MTSKYGYDPFTGLKTWERNGRGYVTTYAYDKYNRLRRTVFADEDDGGLRPGEPGWEAARANNPVKSADFDDVLNTYTITDEEGRRILFTYDGLGHNIRVNYADATPDPADNPHSRTIYDDLWRTVTLIDPNGHQTIQHKDWAGRVVQVDQYETVTGQIYRSYAAYDRLGRKVQVTDGRGTVTRLTYDDLGRLIETVYPAVPMVKPGTGWEVAESPKVTYTYDHAGNKIAETSALGNAQDGVDKAKYTTTYTYLYEGVKPQNVELQVEHL